MIKCFCVVIAELSLAKMAEAKRHRIRARMSCISCKKSHSACSKFVKCKKNLVTIALVFVPVLDVKMKE